MQTKQVWGCCSSDCGTEMLLQMGAEQLGVMAGAGGHGSPPHGFSWVGFVFFSCTGAASSAVLQSLVNASEALHGCEHRAWQI